MQLAPKNCRLSIPIERPIGLLTWLLAALLLTSVFSAAPFAFSQATGTPSAPSALWSIVSNDCHMRLLSRERLTANVTTPGSERLRMVTGQGTQALVAYGLQPLSLIDELEIAVPFFSDQVGQQIMARVVLPRSMDPKTRLPLTFHVRGDLYERAGAWQTLRLPNLVGELDGHVRILRSQYGPTVDGREAFVDLLLVNAYSREGHSLVQLGDPEIHGAVVHGHSALASSAVLSADLVDPSGPVMLTSATRPLSPPRQDVPFHLEGDLLLVADRPFFVRAIQANGEPWTFLQQLGFNTLVLPEPATGQQIRQAEELGLWLIAPPPAVWKGGDLGQPYRRLLAWNLGSHLTARELESVRARAKAVRAIDRVRRRPILCNPDSDLAAFDEIGDILLHHREPIGSSFPPQHFRGWLTSRAAFALAGTPHWATIQTQPLPSVVHQSAALGHSETDIRETLAITAEQIESLALSAVASGMRGLVFASRTALDQSSERARAAALGALNLRLNSIEPWVAGGHVAARGIGNDPSAPTTVLRTARSWLVLPTATDQPTLRDKSMTTAFTMEEGITIPGIPSAIDVFEFHWGGLRSLNHERTVGGIRLPTSDVANRVILLTRDPLVVKHIHHSLARHTRVAADLQRQIGLDLYERTERMLQRLDRSNELLLPAASLLADNDELFTSDRYAKIQRKSAEALEIIRAVRQQVARENARESSRKNDVGKGTKIGLPWSGHLEAAAWHDEALENLVPDEPPTERQAAERLITGDLEDLAAMCEAGWRNWEHAPPWVGTQVELSDDLPRQGKRCLRLSATVIADATDRGTPGRFLEQPPLWITSPPIALPPGERVLIQGWIRMPFVPTHCHDGALLFDSLGGPNLAVRVPADTEWQPFSIVRAVDSLGGSAAELTITLALTGIGQVDLDGLSVTTLDPS